MEIPVCPDPDHAGSAVTRAGWYGKAPHRRQRWWCDPKDAPKHRFTGRFPRQEAESSDCHACRTVLEPWEGPITPRTYAYAEREIGHALLRVAEGLTYRRAANSARLLGERQMPSIAKRIGTHGAEGQLAASWTDIYADVVTEPEAATEWPAVIAIDAMSFRVGSGPNEGRRFQVLCAAGYESRGAAPSVVRMEPAPTKSEAEWEAFLRALPGVPEIIVSDMDKAIGKAVAKVFPMPGTEHRWSEFHVKRWIKGMLPETIAVNPEHPVMEALAVALTHPTKWDVFLDRLDDAEAAGEPVAAASKWCLENTARLYTQAATRILAGPHSTGACEAYLQTVSHRIGERAARMTNRRRARRLLALFTAEINGHADERVWTERIHQHIDGLGGVAPRQSMDNDPKGTITLFSAAASPEPLDRRPRISPGLSMEPWIDPLDGLDEKPPDKDDEIPF